MLPSLMHIKTQPSHVNKTGPSALLITPFQPNKDDIFSKTKEYLEAAQLSAVFIYETEDKETQIEKLKSRNLI